MLSYNLSRKYPFSPRFKNAVFFGCCLLLVTLTVFNLATNGFNMQTTYSIDANSTQDTKYWYNNIIFTWGDDKLDPQCQHVEIPVGYQFMTSNLGLRYTVTGIVYHNETGPQQKRPSISYLNNTLTDCQVDSVDIYLRKSDTSHPWYDWWSWVDSSADAVAHCNVNIDEGLFTINFTVTYHTVATVFDCIPVDALYSYVAIDDFTTHASVWWGTRILTNYFVGTNNTSITENDIFGLEYYFMDTDGNALNSDTNLADVHEVYNNETFELSRPLTECLWFSRVFHSLVLVDLGNSQAPNVLLDEHLLQYALNATGNFNRYGGPLANISALDEWKFARLSPPDQAKEERITSVPMNEAYSMFKDKYHMGNLSTHNATIYAQYICSVPQKKSNGTMALLILVANFALFQTAWTIFKFLSDQVATGKTGLTAMYGEGCLLHDNELAKMEGGDDSLLRPSRASSGRRTSSRTSSVRGLLKYQHLDDKNNDFE
ncbi:hypothetical protein K432DRAFT_311851 [Lepidopterella palustris CBS 459.81]|uniref:Uncharacterized protein n=1 Tax=Lepidopterella palustris CBS 459.81 TaxID=1314670 RepID=A0A8E2DY73_9PEZI|nr:hypothetical protein K432DRAFT_311851 [Lepidopterella palustris CBS 459.81]